MVSVDRRSTSAALTGASLVSAPPDRQHLRPNQPPTRDLRRPPAKTTRAPEETRPLPRTQAPRRSWIHRTGGKVSSALLGALLVGCSYTLRGSGGSDHSAASVPRPSSTVTVPADTIPPDTVPPITAPPTPEEAAVAELNRILGTGNTRLEYDRDFADPFVLRDGEATYFYATNAHWANVPVLDTLSLLENAAPREALPTENLGAWATPNISHVWAPAVAKLSEGRYAMFYSAKERATGLMAVGVAYASSPLGPFADPNEAPILATGKSGAAGRGGVIDASVFQENGRTYLIYKNDGNCCRAETAVWIQEFSEAAGGPVGEPQKMLGDDGRQSWEVAHYTAPHALIEGPRLIEEGGKYYLFYSANDWASAQYGVNYAVADSPFGPYTRAQGPWMQSEEGRHGPGGQEIFEGPGGELFLAYHAWRTPGASNTAGDTRRLVIEPLVFNGGAPLQFPG
jgi:GH43 family beta-xylosidase